MKPKHSISILADLLLVAALSGCGVEASSVVTASASTLQPPAVQQQVTRWPAPAIDNEKGDGSFKVYEYY